MGFLFSNVVCKWIKRNRCMEFSWVRIIKGFGVFILMSFRLAEGTSLRMILKSLTQDNGVTSPKGNLLKQSVSTVRVHCPLGHGMLVIVN